MKGVFKDITNVSKKNFKVTIHKSSHRVELIKWIYEVVCDFEYSQVTYGLTVYIVDKFTQQKSFELADYQLIGISALFVAAKVEETGRKSIDDYVIVTDYAFKPEEILQKEIEILSILDFSIYVKLPHYFLKLWYLQTMVNDLSILERQEILFTSFAYVMERNSCKNNMYWIYLEGIRESERFLSGEPISKEFMFYIEKNEVINNVLKK